MQATTGRVRTVGGRYALRRVLGVGAMGVVHEAENTWTGRLVAVKVLHPDKGAHPDRAERFLREARAASSLRHPNVVDVLDAGQDPDGSLYIVQELLVGEDLRARLAREGRLDEATARAILGPVLRGLAAAHAAGVVHRDVKPANIFLARDHADAMVPKLIDFGIARDAKQARTTATGESLGTPAYMSPELLRDAREVTPAADVWSLGVVLHEMLAGRAPFDGESAPVLIHNVLSGHRRPVGEGLAHVSPGLRAVIDRALSADPRARFADAAEMLRALDADLTPAAAAAPNEPRSRRRWLVAGVLVLAASLAAGRALRGASGSCMVSRLDVGPP